VVIIKERSISVRAQSTRSLAKWPARANRTLDNLNYLKAPRLGKRRVLTRSTVNGVLNRMQPMPTFASLQPKTADPNSRGGKDGEALDSEIVDYHRLI
jgi:hypothetical protein